MMALGLQMPTPTKAPGSSKRARSGKHPGPIAIGTVQLDDHRPNTTLGVRTGFQSRGDPRIAPMSLAPSPVPGSSMSIPQWQGGNWPIDHGMMATGVPMVLNNTVGTYGLYPTHDQPNGSGAAQAFMNSPASEQIDNGSWLVAPGSMSQTLQHRAGHSVIADARPAVSSGRALVGQPSRSISVRESRRVLGETRSAGNQAALNASNMQDSYSHGYAIEQMPASSQLGYAFFDEQQSRQHQNVIHNAQPGSIANSGNHPALRPRHGRNLSSDCIT